MTETTVSTDLLQALKILTELGVDIVGENLAVLAIDNIALTIEEPGWDLVLGGVLDDGDDTLEFFGGEFTSAVHVSIPSRLCPGLSIPLVQINICLLAHQVGVPAANTLYLGERIDDLDSSLNVGVEQSQNLHLVRYAKQTLDLSSIVQSDIRIGSSTSRRYKNIVSSIIISHSNSRSISYLTKDILPAGSGGEDDVRSARRS